MAANDLEAQPVQSPHLETTQDSCEDMLSQHPLEKSTIYVDPMAANASGRFQKHDMVHMSIIEGGIRTKGNFKVVKGRLHASGAYYEYQLVDLNGNSFKNGAWVREKNLRGESGS